MILVLNKIDAITSPAILNHVLDRYPNAIPVSARSNRGIVALTEAVGQALSEEFLDIHVDVALSDGKLLAHLAANGEVLSQEYTDTHVTVHVRLAASAYGMIRERALAVRPPRAGKPVENLPPPLINIGSIAGDSSTIEPTGEVA